MKCAIVDVPQRSPGWFKARLGRLTASDAKHITAFLKGGDESAGRRDLKWRLVCERLTGQTQEDGYVNADMQRGVELEPAAFAAYESETGRLVDRVGFLMHLDLMTGGSPDGAVDGLTGLVEFKCPRPANHVRYLREGAIPKEHRAQLVHLLWLSDAQWIDFVSYCPALPEKMRLFIRRLSPEPKELWDHGLAVERFLRDVDLEVAGLKGWDVLKETA